MLASNELMQVSWFPTLDNAGKVHVVWSQLSDETFKSRWSHWYYADVIREATLNGASFGSILDVFLSDIDGRIHNGLGALGKPRVQAAAQRHEGKYGHNDGWRYGNQTEQ